VEKGKQNIEWDRGTKDSGKAKTFLGWWRLLNDGGVLWKMPRNNNDAWKENLIFFCLWRWKFLGYEQVHTKWVRKHAKEC
jgi:hypothetical protein